MRPSVGAAVAGFVGLVLVVLGVSQPGSPFTSKLPESWIFGVPNPGSNPDRHALIAVAVVYSGLIVVLCAWYWIVSAPTPDDRGGMARLWGVFALWVTPLLVAPPLFSRDVYTYGAEGELVTRGINPYTHGLLSVRGSTFYELADPLWRRAHAPYGPVFFDIARLNAHVSSSVFVTLEGYRLVALFGVVLMAASVPVLARSWGRDRANAFALSALNPLVLLSLIGAMHNDALMVGLLVAGVALAQRGHPVVGIVVCALAALVKVPGFLGIVFIGWDWAPPGAPRRRRAGHVLGSVGIGLGVMAVVSEASGLGWDWTRNLSDPGQVSSWLDPATAVGLSISHLVAAVGGGPHPHGLVTAARAVALGVAAVIVGVLVVRTERYGMARALGWSLLTVVVLGPVVWPWYETWGLVFLALATDVWSRRVVLVASAVACFAAVPSHLTGGVTEVAAAATILVVAAGGAGISLARVRASVAAGAAGPG